jgi:hypothetical protein
MNRLAPIDDSSPLEIDDSSYLRLKLVMMIISIYFSAMMIVPRLKLMIVLILTLEISDDDNFNLLFSYDKLKCRSIGPPFPAWGSSPLEIDDSSDTYA